ncbi:hypothetical protein ACFB49_24260 [Sphingomonas sp. DBB INV C78]|uniref:GntR family transcriptional regulator n=1 Tax=Sphingomonas sp. DBB INV C78 TaxID=3349434 RepID=UPI0036D3B33E
MEIRFDWPKIYTSVLAERSVPVKLASAAVARIEDDIRRSAGPPGGLFGTGPEICERYGLRRETLLEAVRILEDRGIARMRRGPGGGLIVMEAPQTDIALALARYFVFAGLSDEQASDAQKAIWLLHRHDIAARAGTTEAFIADFRNMLASGKTPLHSLDNSARPSLLSLNRSIRPFAEALDKLAEHRERAVTLLYNPPSAGPDTCSAGLAGFVAELLIAEIGRRRQKGEFRVGFELDLADRFGVSRQVLRQAMRLLEDRGVVRCERGRSGGIMATTVHPPGVIERIADHYAQVQLIERDFRPTLSMLGRLNRLLVACKAEQADWDEIGQLIGLQKWEDPTSHMMRIHLEWRVLDNPVLSLLEQVLSAYRARRAGNATLLAVSDLDALRCSVFGNFDCLRSGNLVAADEHFDTLNGQITELLGHH